MHLRRRLVLAAVIASVGFWVRGAFAEEPTSQQLMQQIQQLQSKVQELQTKQDQQATTTRADNDALAAALLNDAQHRSQLLDNRGMFLAGFDQGHFFLKSDDGNFLLIPTARMQFRNVSNYNTNDGDSFENGFEISRARFGIQGNAFSPDLTYKFQVETSSTTGDLSLLDAWVRHDYRNGWGVRIGQFLNPVVHEQLVTPFDQVASERSLVNQIVMGANESYVQGITGIYQRGNWRAEAGLTDGIGSANSDWRDFPVGATNFGVAGRVEYKVYGDWKQYENFSAMNNTHDLLVVGGGGDVSQAGSSTQYLHTFDAQWENSRGLGLYAAYYGNYLDTSGGSTYDWGFLVQGSYMLDHRWEVFGRYDLSKLDSAIAFAGGGSEDTFNEISVGVNYYLYGNNARLTIDGTWLPNGCPANFNDLGFEAGSENQFVLRAQFQLLL